MSFLCEACKQPFVLPYKRSGSPKFCSQKCYHAQVLNGNRPKRKRATCHPDLPHAAFGLCSTCYSKRHRAEHVEKYREASRRHSRKKHYGVLPDEYELRVKQQQCRCAICQDPMAKPFIDHDHKTGKVRGLLCQHCNSAIGFLLDDPVRAECAALYLRSGGMRPLSAE